MPPKIFIRQNGKEGDVIEIPVAQLQDETSGIYPTNDGESIEIDLDLRHKPYSVGINLGSAPNLAAMLRGPEYRRPVRKAQFTSKGVAGLELKDSNILIVDLERVLNPNKQDKKDRVKEVKSPAYAITKEETCLRGIYWIHRIIPASEYPIRQRIGYIMESKDISIFPYKNSNQLDFEGKPLAEGQERIYTPLPDSDKKIEAYEAMVARVIEFEAKSGSLAVGDYIKQEVERNYRNFLPLDIEGGY